MKKNCICYFTFGVILLISFCNITSQSPHSFISKKSIRIMFYNVENLFDIYDDSTKNDNEYLPNSARHWTYKRMNEKINNLYKTIIAVGEWQPPEIIGLCEVENFYVLNELVENTPFSKFQYKIIHHDSPDPRGIDVALIYNNKEFKIFNSQFIKIKYPNSNSNTREILYTKGILNKKDTLHIFVNHWPSRRGGQKKSEAKRIFVSSILKSKIDSIYEVSENSKIIVMGDFNDNPNNKSLNILTNNNDSSYMINLAGNLYNQDQGTCKYQGNWSFFDQFVVSSEVYTAMDVNKMQMAVLEFLFEEDIKFTGKKPKRTYYGYKYNGGFSDHLPVYIELEFNN